MNTYVYPNRQNELKKNYMWTKYFSKLLNGRGNWSQLDYLDILESGSENIDLVYSPIPELCRVGNINANIFHIVDIISDKVHVNRILGKRTYLPRMYFINPGSIEKSKADITKLLETTRSFFYLKISSGSSSKGIYIVNTYPEILSALKRESQNKSWILSENIPSFLYKRKGQYQPNGIKYNEKIGHNGRLKYFILFKIDSKEKSVYMYDQAVHGIAQDEYKGEYTPDQSFVNGLGKYKNIEGYDVDPDFAFNPVTVFGDKYFSKIIPQLSKITHDIFEVTNKDLHCKNGVLYNDTFKSCFHFASVDIIITPKLKCYFLEINTRPVMDKKTYETIMDYPSMIDGVIQLAIDPYYPPKIKSEYHPTWHRVSRVGLSENPHTFYIAPRMKLSGDIRKLFDKRKNWQEVIYPKLVDRIDFVSKLSNGNINVDDPIFIKGVLVSKIHTLNDYLGNKKTMYDILSNDQRSFKFLPLTATFNTTESDYPSIIQHAMEYSDSIKTWILKPSIGLQGKDIFISNNHKEVVLFVKSKPEYTEWVLSQYLDRPFLLKLNGDTIGRKVHIRIYVLITKIDNVPHIYLYDHNLIFSAVEEYRYSDLKYVYSNLTNLYLGSIFYKEVLKKDGGDAYKDLSFPFRETVNKIYGPTFYNKKVFPQIKRMLEIILKNSIDYLECENINGRGCFQYIAIDIMPDENFNLFLLEINGRPGMNAPSYHWKTLENFTNSLLNKTVDVVNTNKRNVINRKGFKLIK